MANDQGNGAAQAHSPQAREATAAAEEPVSHKQAAQVLGISVRTVRRLIERGELERAGTGTDQAKRHAFVTKSSLVALRERRAADAEASGAPSEGSGASRSDLKEIVAELVQPLQDRLWELHEEASSARAEASAERAQRRLLEEHASSMREQDREHERREQALTAQIQTKDDELAKAQAQALRAQQTADQLQAWQRRLAEAGWRRRLAMLYRLRRARQRVH